MTRALVPVAERALAPPRAAPQRDPVVAYLATLAASSRATQRAAIRRAVEILAPEVAVEDFPWRDVGYAEALALRTLLIENGELELATMNRYIAALRGVFKAAWRLEQIGAEQHARIKDALSSVKGSREIAGRMLSWDEVSRLFAACAAEEDPCRRSRDLALFALLRVGLRRHEVAGALLADYEQGILSVVGKGNKERLVPLGKNAAHVDDWLKRRPVGGEMIITHADSSKSLTPQGVRFVVHERSKQAGVEPEPAPHDFRRTYVSELLDAGIDLSRVQQLAGHSDPKTTARYDRRGVDKLREAADVLQVWEKGA